MLPELTSNEARVIGCLMEKSVVTPDQYPLTLNALTNACNQKSARDPIMSLDPGAVQRAARDLASRHMVAIKENFKSGVEKYQQRLCNTTYSDLQLSEAQFAIICLLLLRGPQTAGELRARSARLHGFQDNAEVATALGELIHREGASLVIKLPQTRGRKSAEYAHLLSGAIDIERHAARGIVAREAMAKVDQGRGSDLEERVSVLEADVAELKAQLRRD